MFPLVLIIFSACGSGETPDDPVEAVPADARKIITLNLNKISAANGAVLSSQPGSMTAEAAEAIGLFVPASLMPSLTTVATSAPDAVDTSRAVLFTDRKGYTGIILKVNDADRLADSAFSGLKPGVDIDGCDTYTAGSGIIAIAGNLCVIAPDAVMVRAITDSRAKTRRMSQAEGVTEFLSSDNAIMCAAPAGDIYGDKLKGKWICMAMRFNSTSAIADMMVMAPDGTPDSIGARIARPVDSDVLRFIPQNANLVAASGLQESDGKAFGLETLLSRYYPGDFRMSETGTTAWYGRCFSDISPDDFLSVASWNLASLTAMPPSEGDAATLSVHKYYGNIGRKDSHSPFYTISYDDTSLSYGYFGGYFIESLNGEVTDGNSNPYTQDFEGTHMVVILDIPQGSPLQRAAGLPCGASLTLRLKATGLHAKLSFYGNTAPVLATILSIDSLRPLLPYLINGDN